MEFGMPTLLELEDLASNVKLAQDLGLSFVEINCNLPQFQVAQLNADELLAITQKTGIAFTFHLDEYMSITDPDLKISEAYINSVLETIDFAKRAQIDSLTLHLIKGVIFTLPHKKVYVYEKYKDYYLVRLLEFRDRVTQAIADSLVRVNIENVGGFEPYMREGIELLLQSPCFGLTYDCGHNHRYDHLDWDFIQKHAKCINHMHVHDCKGQSDHQSFGDGDLDLPSEINFVSRSAKRIVIEVKTEPSLTASVATLRLYQKHALLK